MRPILTVGSVAFDSVKTPFGEVSRVVAGAATYFSIAASFFTDVRLVGVVGDDFRDEHLAVFADRRIDLAGLQRVAGETFRWRGEYSFDLNTRETIYTHLNVFEILSPGDSRRVFGAVRSCFSPTSIHLFSSTCLTRWPGPEFVGPRHDELLDRGHAGRAGRRCSQRWTC